MLTVSKREFWIFLTFTFFVKFISCSFFIWLGKLQSPSIILTPFATATGDSDSYLQGFYNLYFHHTYYVNGMMSDKVYAGRMPYYGLLYFVLLPFFSISTIYTLIAIVQILLESLSILLLSQLVFTYTQNKKMFYVTLLFMNACLYVTAFSSRIAPESPGIALMIFAWWYYQKYRRGGNLWNLFFTGVMFNMLTGFKPYIAIIYAVFGLDILLSSNRKGWIIPLRNIAVMCSTIAITTVAWTVRNYSLTHKIIPLTQSYSGVPYPPSSLALRILISDWGGSSEAWNPKAMGSFFYSGTGPGRVSTGTDYKVDQLPITSYYNRDSLLTLRDYISSIDLRLIDLHTDSAIAKRINRYNESYKNEFPFQFYLLSPIRIIAAFTINSGSYYIFSQVNGKNNIFVFAVKVLQSLLYYLFLIGGFIGCIFYFRKLSLYSWIPFYLLFLFCFIIKYVELRYFLYAYPSLVFGLMLVINHLTQIPIFAGIPDAARNNSFYKKIIGFFSRKFIQS